jgi:DNA-binding response OmpR family regulator
MPHGRLIDGIAGGDIVGEMHVLVVEDQERIRSFLEKGLRAEGYAVSAASDSEEAITATSAGHPDVAVVDVMLRDRDDGFELIGALRAIVPDLPVIMLTARSGVEDRVRGLDLGATDYVVKPFAFAELVARIRAHLRKSNARADVIEAGGLRLDLMARAVSRGGASLPLSAREFALLAYLMRHPGQVLSRERLLSGVWGMEFDPRSNVVDVYVGYLRDKVGADRIVTVRGAGYRFCDDRVASSLAS